MGCTSSTHTTSPKKHYSTSKHKSHSKKDVEKNGGMSEDAMSRMKNDILQRHDTEIDMGAQISAERAALKLVSSGRINLRLSCEDLMDSVSSEELSMVHNENIYRNIQRNYAKKHIANSLKQRNKRWVIYNNLGALTESELRVLNSFMRSLVRVISKRDAQNNNQGSDGDIISSRIKGRVNINKNMPDANNNLSLNPVNEEDIDIGLPISGTGSPIFPVASANQLNTSAPSEKEIESNELKSAKSAILEDDGLSKFLRQIPVVTMAPASYYRLQASNLYDYELPPGLVTINEAQVIIELYRQGGRLVPSAVHKLLRLGYKLLEQRPNISRLSISEHERLIIVGDIHGQLPDLLHILDKNGPPNTDNKYVFNGDFVDRGDYGVEVMCVLLSLFIARPDCVYLNRGNHEDFAICSVYGFQQEVYDKYDAVTFGLFVEVFQQLPLYTIVNESVFIVHGGLFHHSDVTLDELNRVNRTTFSLEDDNDEGDDFDPVPRAYFDSFCQQIIRDSLWSDPCGNFGMHPSIRGAGVSFGPDITQKFLATNNLKFVIRSHECIRSGYDEPYVHIAEKPLLCTIFSASDYGGSGNSAAYIEFTINSPHSTAYRPATPPTTPTNHDHKHHASSPESTAGTKPDAASEVKTIAGTNIFYTVHYFFAEPLHCGEFSAPLHTSSKADTDLQRLMTISEDSYFSAEHTGMPTLHIVPIGRGGGGKAFAGTNSSPKLIGSATSLLEIIFIRKHLLVEAFSQIDRDESKTISKTVWLQIMANVINISLSWAQFADALIPESARVYRNAGIDVDCDEDDLDYSVKYDKFIETVEDEVFRKFISNGRQKAESKEEVTISALENYILSLNESGAHPNSAKAAEEREGEGGKEEKTPADVNMVDEVKGEGEGEVGGGEISREHYFGHDVTEQAVASLYSPQYKIVQSAFQLFDHDKDGLFSLLDFERGLAELGISISYDKYECYDAEQLLQIMDIFECGEIDINIFMEMFRLAVINHSPDGIFMLDERMSRKFSLQREASFAMEMRRMSLSTEQITIVHQSSQSGLVSLELKRGKEIAVDAELASSLSGNTTSSNLTDIDV